MSLISSAPFSKVTTYRNDYVRRPGFRPSKPIQQTKEYADPILGPVEEYLLPYCKLKELPEDQTTYPDPKAYAEEVRDKYSSTRIFFEEPTGALPDFDVIDKIYLNRNQTTYMLSYCKTGDFDSKKKRQRTRASLPEDWEVPLTTYRSSYRKSFFTWPKTGLTFKISPAKDNLVPNKKEREILQVKTESSIYETDINKTGREIIEGKLHGDVTIRPYFSLEDLIKAQMIRKD